MQYAALGLDSIQNANEEPAPMGEGSHFRFIDSDAALVNSLRTGDTGAFEVLVKRHQGRLLKTALNITNNREDAEEAVQDAFLKAFKHLDNFRGHSRFVTWLTRITINQALMVMRARPR
jgi:RNA polymerase sigma-70 factor (ECF subfamily)